MALGDILRLVVNSTLYSENVQNCLYYLVTADDEGPGNETAVAQQFFTTVIPFWQSAVVDAVEFTCIQTQKVFPAPNGSTFDRIESVTGNLTGQGLPATDSGLIRKFNPAVSGIGRKGRVYVAGMPEANTNLGRITVLQGDLLEELAEELVKVLGSAANGLYQPVWAVRDTLPPFPIEGSVSWLNFTIMPRIATQRRRRTPIVGFSPA